MAAREDCRAVLHIGGLTPIGVERSASQSYTENVGQARVAVSLLVFALAVAPTFAQVQRQPGYFDILEIYRNGEFDRAIAAVAAWSPEYVETLPHALAGAGAERLRAAALLHLEVAMSARVRRHPAGWFRHEAIARLAVVRLEEIDTADPFPATWWMLNIAFLEAEGDLVNAVATAAAARRTHGDTPLLMLSVGAAHEMSWTWKQDGASSPLKGDLGTAVSLYRRALRREPTLIEARVRLGRALMLDGNLDEALTTLATVSDQAERGYGYLARLFEGDALEREGSAAAAERAYQTAALLMPRAQSARMALAHMQHAHGRRSEAAERIQSTTAEPERLETADPWYWYTRGMAWRVNPCLETLRGLVTRR